jgi:hypothetical protein
LRVTSVKTLSNDAEGTPKSLAADQQPRIAAHPTFQLASAL